MGPRDLPLPLLKWAIKVNIGSLVTNGKKPRSREGKMLIKRENPQLSKAFDIVSSLGFTECSGCRFSAVVLPASSQDHFKSSGNLEIRKRR